jgi:NADH dehydrogenase FAD-containing subunit
LKEARRSSRDDNPGTEIFAVLGFLLATGSLSVQHQNVDIAIIGGGATGVILAIQLLRQSPSSLNITLIDRGPDVGSNDL